MVTLDITLDYSNQKHPYKRKQGDDGDIHRRGRANVATNAETEMKHLQTKEH